MGSAVEEVSRLGDDVQPLLDEEFFPAAVGTLRVGPDGGGATLGELDLETVALLADLAGMPCSTISDLRKRLHDHDTAHREWQRALEYADHHEEDLIRRACGHLASEMAHPQSGSLISSADAAAQAWSDFRRQCTSGIAAQMLDKGLILGPDRHGAFHLTVSPATALERLAAGGASNRRRAATSST